MYNDASTTYYGPLPAGRSQRSAGPGAQAGADGGDLWFFSICKFGVSRWGGWEVKVFAGMEWEGGMPDEYFVWARAKVQPNPATP